MKNILGSRGFTLIELLIVVVIIGILAAVATPRFQTARTNAIQASVISDLKNLAPVQETYWSLEGAYAADMAVLNYRLSPGVSIDIILAAVNGWAAEATHSALPGEVCAAFFGFEEAPDLALDAVGGQVVCSF